jgi:hypothetical protein
MAYNLFYITKLKSEVMKTMKMNKVSLFLAFGFFLIFLNGNSQDIRLSRQERKEVRKAQMAANFYLIDSLLNAKSFVLEADYLANKYGYMIPVVSNLNFIKVDGSNGILQTGSNTGIGYNNVGGVTTQGNIGDWKLTKNLKSMSFSLHFNLLTNLGAFDILMTVSSDNHASATITANNPGRLTWDGHLKTIDNSRVYKGRETF